MHIRLLIVVCVMICSAQAQQVKPVFSLTVMVRDSITGQPLEDATVLLTKHAHIHLTNLQGKVVFDTLQAGHYHLACTFVGYHNHEEVVVVTTNQTVVLSLCPEAYHLHETIVEGQALHEQTTFSLQAKSELSAMQIEKLRGQNLGDLLQQITGVSTLTTGPGIAKPVVRGLHSNRLVTLNNGIRQEEQQWGSEHAPAIDPFAVNGIELIKGAASAEYGPEAIGGAIRLLPPAYRKSNGVGGVLSLQGLSNNTQGAVALKLEGTHVKNQSLGWRAQGSLRKAGDSRAPDYVISNTGINERNGSIALFYHKGPLRIETFVSLFTTTIGIMRAAHIGSATDLQKAIQSNQPLIIKPFTYTVGKPYQQVWHETQSVRLNYELGKIGKLGFQSGRQLNSRQEYDLGVSWNAQSVASAKPAYDLTLTTYTQDMVFEHNQWKQFTGKIGVSWMHQSNYTDGTQKPLIPNFIANTYGGFVFEKWQKGRWAAEVGSRFDSRSQTIYVRNNSNQIVIQSRDYHRATAIVGAGYAFTEKWNVNTTVSSAWRPPSINELYSNGLHNGTATYELGDSNLVPEQSFNWDLTLKYHDVKWSVEASVYRNAIEDFIYQLPVLPPTITLRGTFPTFQFTQTQVLMQGAEVNASYLLHANWLTTVSVTYLKADDVTHDQPLVLMPTNRYKIGVQYQRNALWKIEQFYVSVNGLYVAKQNRYQPGLDYKDPPPAYQLFDVNIGFQIPFYKQHLTVSASVKNVLNTTYRDYLNRFRYFTDEVGRNITIRVSIPFELFTTKK
jgi:iron complex outermembrane recepter protein